MMETGAKGGEMLLWWDEPVDSGMEMKRRGLI